MLKHIKKLRGCFRGCLTIQQEEMRPQNSFEKLITLLNNRIPLPKRAMLILLIPFITLILLSGFLTYDLYKKYENISGIAQVSKSFICINSITDNFICIDIL